MVHPIKRINLFTVHNRFSLKEYNRSYDLPPVTQNVNFTRIDTLLKLLLSISYLYFKNLDFEFVNQLLNKRGDIYIILYNYVFSQGFNILTLVSYVNIDFS